MILSCNRNRYVSIKLRVWVHRMVSRGQLLLLKCVHLSPGTTCKPPGGQISSMGHQLITTDRDKAVYGLS